jgi:peptidoglycan hydrolase-like protein with peptidoglycan-binding domain
VQAALSRAAYGPLNVDGRPGPQTRDAIMRFQLDEGLPVTGKLDDALVKKLKAVGALGA